MKYYLIVDESKNQVIYGSTSPNACQRAYLEQAKRGNKCKISILDGLGEYQNV